MIADRPGLLLAAVFLAFTPAANGQLTPPTLLAHKPVGGAPGEVVAVELKGTDLEGASALRFDDPRVKVEGLEVTKDTLKARVTLPPDVAVGAISFRAVSPLGISNPQRLWVGHPIPTYPEAEPNNGFLKPQVIPVPTAVEGAIEPGDDVDVYAVQAQEGETLVAEVVAARAGSALDALVTIFTPEGRELAGDDDRFGRDAAATALIPRTGRYFVQVQDANGRAQDAKLEQGKTREYRLEVGRLPLVSSASPPGARRGSSTAFHLVGVNLAGDRVPFNIPADAPLGDFRLPLAGTNPWTIRVGDAPEVAEAEAPNDEIDHAQAVAIPAAIHGTFAAANEPDTDFFRLKAATGQEGDYVITAYAARIGSPADPVLTILDDKGATLAEDDDKLGRDARLERAIDATTGIVLAIRERFGRGGTRYAYRIEVVHGGGRLAISADLGARTLPRDGRLAIPLAVDRRGVEGAWNLLAEGLPAGVTAAPVALPAGAKGAVLVLSAAADAPLVPFALRLAATPADDLAKGSPPVALAFQEAPGPVTNPQPNMDPNQPRPNVESDDATLAIAERAPLGIAIEPAEITVARGAQVEVKVTLDRRADAAKKPAKIRLLAGEGVLDGFEPIKEASVAADVNSATFTLNAKPDAPARRVVVSARAWLDGAAESRGVSAAPVILIVPEPAR